MQVLLLTQLCTSMSFSNPHKTSIWHAAGKHCRSSQYLQCCAVHRPSFCQRRSLICKFLDSPYGHVWSTQYVQTCSMMTASRNF